MTSSEVFSEATHDDVMLAATCYKNSPKANRLTQALLKAEKAARAVQIDPQALLGSWQLRFTAPKKPRLQDNQPTSSGFYIPRGLRAEICFLPQQEPTAIAIQNSLTIGPLRMIFRGNAQPIGKRNVLAFEFTHLQINFAALTIYQRKLGPSQLSQASNQRAPFFAFFAAHETYIAARGRGGGIALWVKART